MNHKIVNCGTEKYVIPSTVKNEILNSRNTSAPRSNRTNVLNTISENGFDDHMEEHQ